MLTEDVVVVDLHRVRPLGPGRRAWRVACRGRSQSLLLPAIGGYQRVGHCLREAWVPVATRPAVGERTDRRSRTQVRSCDTCLNFDVDGEEHWDRKERTPPPPRTAPCTALSLSSLLLVSWCCEEHPARRAQHPPRAVLPTSESVLSLPSLPAFHPSQQRIHAREPA